MCDFLHTHTALTGGVVFSDSQRKILLKYFDEFGMTSTHRRNSELIERCSTEVGTTVERVKVPSCCVCWIQDSYTAFSGHTNTSMWPLECLRVDQPLVTMIWRSWNKHRKTFPVFSCSCKTSLHDFCFGKWKEEGEGWCASSIIAMTWSDLSCSQYDFHFGWWKKEG